MKHQIKLITFASIVSVSLVGCGKILYKLRTEKKCDPNNIEKGIYGGCEITPEVENKLLELNSSVLINTSFYGASFGNTCTGNFISENIILTAGHCITKKDKADNNLPIMQIAIENEKKVHTHYMEKTIKNPTYVVHPHYKANAKYVEETKSDKNTAQSKNVEEKGNPFSSDDFADLALIYSPISATELNAKIIRLSESTKKIERVYFVGYGQLSNIDDLSNIKEKRWGTAFITQSVNKDLNSTIFKDQNKKVWHINDFWYTYFANKYISGQYKTKTPAESFLVTIGLQNEEGVCSGDSGGVIFIKRDNEFLGAGVVHASSGKCSDKVSYNMKIGAYKDWILSESAEIGQLKNNLQKINFVP
ncbi:trypsin-like serine protease [Fluviispira sanaruensis]|uniref:Peptidase S1 domain-containing protein n=1 Tax=Fluviispira sanaruensis TaxID=2493639 RepID=A0A4P2VJD1_FLUSA|nr:trypsin-like serine protease [Fluviispira sanaruensis]BBH53246.1 hypothetical protein JCM31447_16890 [Fluviispira sanaruensis]